MECLFHWLVSCLIAIGGRWSGWRDYDCEVGEVVFMKCRGLRYDKAGGIA